ncbi:hypothetical protein [Clostridium tarantellae]|uniref:Uncharacterized protein n=1 Tax=Clostridium tarantellae TaxID=39493 RepID=A0A6I1MKC6_9CLOT|nr:hypothetical protein [Clostridium tarantellae]MPQ43845.1 hypothetical protein [Clostridium tarantellae]
MGHGINSKRELKLALSSVMSAEKLLNEALITVEYDENKQLLQNTLSNVNNALKTTRTASYGFIE